MQKEQDISLKNITRIAFPIMISGLSQHLVQFVDAAFVGQLGEVELGAVGNTGVYYLIFFLVSMGIANGGQIIMSRRNGEKRYQEIGRLHFHILLLLMLVASFSFLILQYFSPYLFSMLFQSEAIIGKSIDYLEIRSWGIFAGLINASFIAFLTGITQTRILMTSTFLMGALNIFLDYALIFGHFGFPAWGVEGAALATVLSECAVTVFYFLYLWIKIDPCKYNLFRSFQLEIEIFWSILRMASPMMLQFLISISAWFAFFTIIEKMGEQELAISQIVKNIYMILLVPAFSYNQTTNTLVSNLLGQGRDDLIFPLIKKVMVFVMSVNVICFMVLLNIPDILIGLFTNNEDLFETSKRILWIIGLAMFFVASGFSMLGAITGIGHTKVCLIIDAICIVTYLTYVVMVALILKYPLEMVWYGEFAYFGMLTILCFLYLRFSNWRMKTKLT